METASRVSPWLLSLTLLFSHSVVASDLLRQAGSAANEGAAGIVGFDPNPQTALLSNPALLSRQEEGVYFSLSSLWADAEFTTKQGFNSQADRGPGVFPELAVKRELGDGNWSWGAGLVIQSAMQADFLFQDPPGTAGVSYGLQTHRSAWLVAKGAAALSYRMSEALSLGVSLGAAYNRNELEAPYIFQSHPVLSGLKVLVDLEADDIALTSSLGLDYAPGDDLRFNLAYSLATDFSADGELSGNLGQLGLGIQDNFRYDANVETTLPASLLAAVTWRASERLELGLQWNRIFWEDAFEELPIRLTRGSNAELNAFLGEDFIFDTAPLAWEDQDVLQLGGQYQLREGGKLRFGYETSEAIVPRRTFTPMTGAILDEAYTLGLEFALGERNYDIAYRFARGEDFAVNESGLAGGEYDNTRFSLGLHSLVLSFRF